MEACGIRCPVAVFSCRVRGTGKEHDSYYTILESRGYCRPYLQPVCP